MTKRVTTLSTTAPSTPHRRRSFLAAVLAGFALLLVACSPGEQGSGGANTGYQAGDGSFSTWDAGERPAPIDLSATDYEGDPVDLSQMRGDVVVVNFWYAACPPCRVEAPHLAEISNDYADDGVHLLGVNPRDDVGTAQAFERSFDIPYPSVHDADASAVSSFEGLVPLQAMPTTVVLDQDGSPAARVLGQIDPEVLRGLIDDVLAEEQA